MSIASRQREAERMKSKVHPFIKPTKTFRISKEGKTIGKPKYHRQRNGAAVLNFKNEETEPEREVRYHPNGAGVKIRTKEMKPVI